MTPDLFILVHFLWAVLGLMLTHGPYLYSHFVTLPCNGRDPLSVVMLKKKRPELSSRASIYINKFSFLVCKSVLLFISLSLCPSYCMFVCYWGFGGFLFLWGGGELNRMHMGHFASPENKIPCNKQT